MAGKIHQLINQLIEIRSNGRPMIASTTRTKLLIKGVRVDDWTPTSPDEPATLQKIRDIAKEMGITL